MLRFNGGFGGSDQGLPKAPPTPERAPDGHWDLPIRPEQALIYRLSGDDNPLHADPAVAVQAGFPMPILHGLCSFAMSARAMVAAVAEGDETRLRSFGLRFSSPVFPGETLRVEYWRVEGGDYAFRAKVIERDVVVQTGGRAVFAA
jgi:acyl dehydratase